MATPFTTASEALEGTSEAGIYITGHRGEMVNRHLAKPLTKRGASALIDTLTGLPRKPAAERADLLEALGVREVNIGVLADRLRVSKAAASQRVRTLEKLGLASRGKRWGGWVAVKS